MNSLQRDLHAFVYRRLTRLKIDLSANDVGWILIRELAALSSPPGPEQTWQRRPSISNDGTPVILSWKIGRTPENGFRLLTEPGGLGMTVAQQVAFSLVNVDRLLALLGWHNAAVSISALTTEVFPSDPQATLGWRGGIWLGANVLPSGTGQAADSDLRIYLNLRHGDASSRWRRLAILVSSFVSLRQEISLDRWLGIVNPLTIPVGVGLVVAMGQVRALRAYVCVYYPTLESLSTLCSLISTGLPPELAEVYRRFTDVFGCPRPRAVTVGYDFVHTTTSAILPARIKLDICCELVTPEQRLQLPEWISGLLAALRLESYSFEHFMADVNCIWKESSIQYLSLGFTPELRHVTVYVKPCL